MKHTVVAVFDQAAQAQRAAEVLKGQGFDPFAVHVTETTEEPDTEVPAAAQIEGGPATGLLHRLAMLFNVEEPHVAHYVEAVRRGGSVVRVDAGDEAQATAARDALLALGAVNIDDRVDEWQQGGWTSPATGAPARGSRAPGATSAGTDGATSATVGTRGVVHRHEVSIGGVRVYGHTAGNAFDDFAAEFVADYEARYAIDGGTYDDFDPAYRYGHALASDSRYEGRDWADIESEARADWERRYPQSAWQRFKSAVQHAWERVKR
jgi:hypothetical protein